MSFHTPVSASYVPASADRRAQRHRSECRLLESRMTYTGLSVRIEARVATVEFNASTTALTDLLGICDELRDADEVSVVILAVPEGSLGRHSTGHGRLGGGVYARAASPTGDRGDGGQRDRRRA